jgi:micrococcal nuclease
MKREFHIRSIALAGVRAAAFVTLLIFLWQGHADAGPALRKARVLKVHDGDTITLRTDRGKHKVRLIGIDAPETGQKPWGSRSRQHLIRIMRQTKWAVSVETDVVKQDKYGRPLVYLWTRKKELINERMLRDGYAVLFTIQPNSKYADRFEKAQHDARENKLGIWGEDGLAERPLDYKQSHPRDQAPSP